MGESGNVMYEMATKAGIIGSDLDKLGSIFVKYNGENIPEAKLMPLWLSYQDLLTAFANKTEPLSQLFKEYVERHDSLEVDKEHASQFFRTVVEGFTVVSNWDDENGIGIRSFVNINGSTALSLSKGGSSILHMMMVEFVV